MRLVDQLDLVQEEAGHRMSVSRGTVWRLLQSGRKKVAQALVEGREIVLSPRSAPGEPPSTHDEELQE
ncbi:MAG: DUF134 domain-containing protein [Candidatus Freyarchaeota archaeon]|nr:DUF134 domain-containing protein [Candidatus Jordarchaeia archaeon]